MMNSTAGAQASREVTTSHGTWDLIPLTPGFIEAEHGGYVRAITKALNDPEIRNLALSGSYGVGKSSILRRVSALMTGRVVELSLSTLAPIEREPASDGVPTQATTPTNQIQQEIVKQLLYREDPSSSPGSRFRRIERFGWTRRLALASLAGLAATIVFLITGWAIKISDVLSPVWDIGIWIYPLLLVAVSGVTFVASHLLRGRLRVKQFSAGPASVTLDDNSMSYFDQYLDEIVYFFETSGHDVVVFEDIDRFNDARIFETLRSLNTLLNVAPQIGRPIRFVYAIRDSIFDRLGFELEGRGADPLGAGRDDPARAEVYRANRTKFFDLVIPVVPFITHRSARNLTTQVLKGIDHKVSPDLIDLAGRHIPDMRLLKNVRNEFVVFRDRVFSGAGNKLGLSETDLFAMMLYKSTHLADFEAIRMGESRLDQLYFASRELVATSIRRLEREAREIHQKMRRAGESVSRSMHLGESLLAHFGSVAQSVGYRERNGRYFWLGSERGREYLKSVEFWREMATAADEEDVTWSYRYEQQRIKVTRAGIQEVLGQRLDVDEWGRVDREECRAALEDNRENVAFLRGADMGSLIQRSDFQFVYGGETESLDMVAAQLLTRGLAFDLVRAGYINRNFTLYTSTFHGDRVGPAATTFIIHHVERNLMDPYFELAAEDADAVIREFGERSLNQAALFNISILDRVLSLNGTAADVMVGALARLDDDAKRFLQAYLANGHHRDLLVQRLVKRSSQTLNYLATGVEFDDETKLGLLSTALANLADHVGYEVDAQAAGFLRERCSDLDVLRTELPDAEADRVAAILELGAAKVADLAALSSSARAALIARDLYLLDRANLAAAVGAGAGLALDVIRSVNVRVYRYVLANLGAYLDAIVGTATTNDGASGLAETLADVLETSPRLLEDVVAGASSESLVEDLKQVDSEAWPVLARYNRFPATLDNVVAYVEEIGVVDRDLAVVLAKAGSVTIPDACGQPERVSLALRILKSRQALSPELRTELVAGLGVSSHFDVDDIEVEEGELFPRLLRLDLIPDDEYTFARMAQTAWSTREGVIRASSRASSLVTPDFVGADLPRILDSPAIDREVKTAVVDRAAGFATVADRAGLDALARVALSEGRAVSLDVVEAMATKGVPPALVVPLLAPHLQNLDNGKLFGILDALGAGYGQLTSPGWDRPTIEGSASAVLLLESLRQRGVVNTYGLLADSTKIRVNKRHKP